TVGYMSPEQVRGEKTDHRSDIFSFGAILHEMLTGRRAFKRETMAETMTAILKEEPEVLSTSNPNISPALERIVNRCLEKKPARRFQSTADLGFALESLSASRTSEGSPWPPITTELEAKASSRLWKIVAFAAILLVVLFSIGAFILVKRASTTPPPTYQRLSFNRGTIRNARFAPDGQTVVYTARWNGNPSDVFTVRAGKAEARPLNLENSDVLAISSSNEMAILRNLQGRNLGTLARVPVDGGTPRDILEDVQDADWSPDGTKLAVVRLVNGRDQLEYPLG